MGFSNFWVTWCCVGEFAGEPRESRLPELRPRAAPAGLCGAMGAELLAGAAQQLGTGPRSFSKSHFLLHLLENIIFVPVGFEGNSSLLEIFFSWALTRWKFLKVAVGQNQWC